MAANQCSGFLVCMQMLMHAIACKGFTNTVRESALKVDWKKNPLSRQGLEHTSVLHLCLYAHTHTHMLVGACMQHAHACT